MSSEITYMNILAPFSNMSRFCLAKRRWMTFILFSEENATFKDGFSCALITFLCGAQQSIRFASTIGNPFQRFLLQIHFV